jgi:hypothetical protein
VFAVGRWVFRCGFAARLCALARLAHRLVVLYDEAVVTAMWFLQLFLLVITRFARKAPVLQDGDVSAGAAYMSVFWFLCHLGLSYAQCL